MTRLRLWLARKLLPAGYEIIEKGTHDLTAVLVVDDRGARIAQCEITSEGVPFTPNGGSIQTGPMPPMESLMGIGEPLSEGIFGRKRKDTPDA